MYPQQAWETVINQLKLEMPKPAFDTWLRDATYLDYTEDTFTIGLPDERTKAWVENRLTSHLTRSLTGILNRDVRLNFVVHSPTQSELTSPESPPPPNDTDLHLNPLRTSLRNLLIRPERVVVVPGYFLRWLPYLKPAKAWIVVAMRQAFFFCHGKKAKADVPFQASGAQIARWAGMTRKTLRGHLEGLHPKKPGNMLSWFLQRERGVEGHASTFRFLLEMPLTPGDAETLENWLLTHGIKDDPLWALKHALERQPRELLPFPPPPPQPTHFTMPPNPRTVPRLVLDTCLVQPQSETYLEVVRMASELESRLMPPADQLVITHYFLRHWLPLLKAGPAWLVTLLRDRGYYNRHTGELRDSIEITNGYRDLATTLGIQRTRTIGEWLPPLERFSHREAHTSSTWRKRQQTRQLVSLFLSKSDSQIDHSGKQGTTWQFKIRMAEPLIPEHKMLHDGLLLAIQNALKGERHQLEYLLDEEGRYANSPPPASVGTRTPQGSVRDLRTLKASRYADSPAHSASGTRSPHPEPQGRDADSPGVGTQITQLKALLKKHPDSKALQNFLKHSTTPRVEGEAEKESVASSPAGVGVGTLWDFETLLAREGISSGKRASVCALIAREPVAGQRFLGWLLYGYANRSSEDRQGIDAPALFALSRLHLTPGPDYLELATRSPRELAKMLDYQSPTGTSLRGKQILAALKRNGFEQLLKAVISSPHRTHAAESAR